MARKAAGLVDRREKTSRVRVMVPMKKCQTRELKQRIKHLNFF